MAGRREPPRFCLCESRMASSAAEAALFAWAHHFGTSELVPFPSSRFRRPIRLRSGQAAEAPLFCGIVVVRGFVWGGEGGSNSRFLPAPSLGRRLGRNDKDVLGRAPQRLKPVRRGESYLSAEALRHPIAKPGFVKMPIVRVPTSRKGGEKWGTRPLFERAHHFGTSELGALPERSV